MCLQKTKKNLRSFAEENWTILAKVWISLKFWKWQKHVATPYKNFNLSHSITSVILLWTYFSYQSKCNYQDYISFQERNIKQQILMFSCKLQKLIKYFEFLEMFELLYYLKIYSIMEKILTSLVGKKEYDETVKNL